jgi:hypothetical protein
MARWFESQRIAFIAEMLHIYGFINREHLMRKFGISMPQASKDLQSYLQHSAGSVSYHLRRKRYEARWFTAVHRSHE